MRELNIIHAADLHLDSPFEALGAKAQERREEQRALLSRIAELANERGADLLLLAGDLLDTASAYAETGEVLVSALGSVKCPVFISPGNHDYYGAFSPYARLKMPENVHVFTKNALQYYPIPELNVRVWGAAFTDVGSRPILRGVTVPKQEDTLDVCVLHGEAEAPASRYDPVTAEDIANSGMDYIALGHIHTFGGLRRAGNTFYAWPGCPEGRGFDECGEKGVLQLRLSSGACAAELIPTCARRYEVLECPYDAVMQSVPAGAQRDIYRIVLTGECETPPDAEALQKQLADRFYALQIVDKTRVRRDIWALSERDDLRGVFLRKMRARLDAAQSEDEKNEITQATRWALAALDRGEAVRAL